MDTLLHLLIAIIPLALCIAAIALTVRYTK
jgi:hypothetical protein